MAHRAHIGLISALKPYLLPTLVGVYFAAHHAQRFGWGPEVFRFYAKDFMLVPLLLCASNLVMSFLKKPFKPGTKELVVTVFYVTMVFEVILPVFGTNFVTDPVDILCYALGALFYKSFLRDTNFIIAPLTTC